MDISPLLYFIRERHAIYLRRKAGEPWPWTEDKILQAYSFCNIYRELDKGTIWIQKNISEPYADHPDLWFMLCAARQINWPDTLQEMLDLGCLQKWNPVVAKSVMEGRKDRGLKTVTGAYLTIGMLGGTKAEQIIDKCLNKLYGSKMPAQKLEEMWAFLVQYPGWGSFLSAQAVCDMKHTKILRSAPDWWAWAAKGPGSARGLNRVLGRPVNAPWRQADWLEALQGLSRAVAPEVDKMGYPELCMMNLQNITCEYDKYTRVRLGEGRPRTKYHPPA